MPIRRHILTWLALLLLLSMTIAASFLQIGQWRQVINLAIAMAKAGLILWIFMDMREETVVVRLSAVTAALLLFFLLVMLGADYELRPMVIVNGF